MLVAKPDLVVPLCDGDTPPESATKRINKVILSGFGFKKVFLDQMENLNLKEGGFRNFSDQSRN